MFIQPTSRQSVRNSSIRRGVRSALRSSRPSGDETSGEEWDHSPTSERRGSGGRFQQPQPQPQPRTIQPVPLQRSTPPVSGETVGFFFFQLIAFFCSERSLDSPTCATLSSAATTAARTSDWWAANDAARFGSGRLSAGRTASVESAAAIRAHQNEAAGSGAAEAAEEPQIPLIHALLFLHRCAVRYRSDCRGNNHHFDRRLKSCLFSGFFAVCFCLLAAFFPLRSHSSASPSIDLTAIG